MGAVNSVTIPTISKPNGDITISNTHGDTRAPAGESGVCSNIVFGTSNHNFLKYRHLKRVILTEPKNGAIKQDNLSAQSTSEAYARRSAQHKPTFDNARKIICGNLSTKPKNEMASKENISASSVPNERSRANSKIQSQFTIAKMGLLKCFGCNNHSYVIA